MQQVSFHAPGTVEEACELLDRHGADARVLAGGQSLIQLLKQRLVDADHVVDITGIDGLGGIEVADGTLRIGATETYAAVRESEAVADAAPVLPEAVGTIGDEQIRNRGTLVGGIAHADPEGDPPMLAVALDARIRLRSRDGARTVRGPEFYEGFFETAREPDELVTAVEFPVLDDREIAVYESFTPRMGDYAVAAVALRLRLRPDDTVGNARAVVGAIETRPVRVDAVEDTLEGEPLDAIAGEASEVARESVDAEDDEEFSAAYKESLVGTLTADAVESARDRAAAPDGN